MRKDAVRRRDFLGKTAVGAACFSSFPAFSMLCREEHADRRTAARCSFGKVVVTDTFEDQRPKVRDLEARLLYVADGEKQWLLVAFDFLNLRRSVCSKLREILARETGVPSRYIWIHATHNHSAPGADQIVGQASDELAEACLPVARRIQREGEEAELSYVVGTTERSWNIRREQYVSGLGNVTCWHTWDFDEHGRAWSSTHDQLLLRDWKPDLLNFDGRLCFDRPTDSQTALLVFRSQRTHEVLGHLSRWTAHPVIMNRSEELPLHPDWPGLLREALERELGGVGVAVNGPCGDTAPKARSFKTTEGAAKECRRLAEEVAKEFMTAWRRTQPRWQPLRLGESKNGRVNLPLRDTVPVEPEGVAKQPAERKSELDEEIQKARASGKPAFTIKRLIDLRQHWQVLAMMCRDYVGVSPEELAGRELSVEQVAVRVGDLVLAGWAGEGMTDTSLWLQAHTFGRQLITFGELNGYAAYLTTPDQFDHGGYSFWGGLISREAEPILRERGRALVFQAYHSLT